MAYCRIKGISLVLQISSRSTGTFNNVLFCCCRYRLTAIAVDNSAGPYQNYTILFIGSEAGVVLKVLAKTPLSLNNSVLLEEIDVFNHGKYVVIFYKNVHPHN